MFKKSLNEMTFKINLNEWKVLVVIFVFEFHKNLWKDEIFVRMLKVN
jgi:hypothetical protein